jgi:hypothetical protein
VRLRTHSTRALTTLFFTVASTVGRILDANCAIQRRTLQIELVRFTYEKRAMQSYEKMRNSLGLNYKSAVLPTELCRQKMPLRLGAPESSAESQLRQPGSRIGMDATFL